MVNTENTKTTKKSTLLAIGMTALLALPATKLSAEPQLSGTWSDPPPSAEDAFCHVGCPVDAREYLTTSLNDPTKLHLTFAQLRTEATRYMRTKLMPEHLTEKALSAYPFSNNTDPSLVSCAPWGFVRQILSPHAMELTQNNFHDLSYVTIYYSEWTAQRIIYLDGRQPPADLTPSLLGFSVGHYEDDVLVVETSGISANHHGFSGFAHSDQLTATERFTRSADGSRLDLDVTFQDPITFSKPLRMARAWAWAPTEKIYDYDACVAPGNN